MNIQQLIDNAKQSLNAPQHHHAFDESFESCIKMYSVYSSVSGFASKIQTIQVQNNLPDGERYA